MHGKTTSNGKHYTGVNAELFHVEQKTQSVSNSQMDSVKSFQEIQFGK